LNNTKQERARLAVERAATRLIARAEALGLASGPYGKQGQQEELLRDARAYAAAVDKLAKVPS